MNLWEEVCFGLRVCMCVRFSFWEFKGSNSNKVCYCASCWQTHDVDHIFCFVYHIGYLKVLFFLSFFWDRTEMEKNVQTTLINTKKKNNAAFQSHVDDSLLAE